MKYYLWLVFLPLASSCSVFESMANTPSETNPAVSQLDQAAGAVNSVLSVIPGWGALAGPAFLAAFAAWRAKKNEE